MDVLQENASFFTLYSLSLGAIWLIALILKLIFYRNTEPYERAKGVRTVFIAVQIIVLFVVFLIVGTNNTVIGYFTPFLILFLLSFFYSVDSIMVYNEEQSKGILTYFVGMAVIFFGYGMVGILKMKTLVDMAAAFY